MRSHINDKLGSDKNGQPIRLANYEFMRPTAREPELAILTQQLKWVKYMAEFLTSAISLQWR